jgi:hypothetical protein
MISPESDADGTVKSCEDQSKVTWHDDRSVSIQQQTDLMHPRDVYLALLNAHALLELVQLRQRGELKHDAAHKKDNERKRARAGKKVVCK